MDTDSSKVEKITPAPISLIMPPEIALAGRMAMTAEEAMAMDEEDKKKAHYKNVAFCVPIKANEDDEEPEAKSSSSEISSLASDVVASDKHLISTTVSNDSGGEDDKEEGDKSSDEGDNAEEEEEKDEAPMDQGRVVWDPTACRLPDLSPPSRGPPSFTIINTRSPLSIDRDMEKQRQEMRANVHAKMEEYVKRHFPPNNTEDGDDAGVKDEEAAENIHDPPKLDTINEGQDEDSYTRTNETKENDYGRIPYYMARRRAGYRPRSQRPRLVLRRSLLPGWEPLPPRPAKTEEGNPAETGEVNPAETHDGNSAETEEVNPVETEEVNPAETKEVNPRQETQERPRLVLRRSLLPGWEPLPPRPAKTEEGNSAETEEGNSSETEEGNSAKTEKVNPAETEEVNPAEMQKVNPRQETQKVNSRQETQEKESFVMAFGRSITNRVLSSVLQKESSS